MGEELCLPYCRVHRRTDRILTQVRPFSPPEKTSVRSPKFGSLETTTLALAPTHILLTMQNCLN